MITSVQKSFKEIAPIAQGFGQLFYARLFQACPELRPLFGSDMQSQARKLMQMLALMVNGLHRLEASASTIEELAHRHRAYGVLDAHYAIVGETLLWTLEQALGPAFTPELRTAWQTAYERISGIMIGRLVTS